MSFSTDITEQYLDKVYEDLSKENNTLLNKMKNTNMESVEKQTACIMKEVSCINTLLINIMKLKNIKKANKLKLLSQ